MPKFRKKPVVIEATQFHAEQLPWPAGVRWRTHLDGDRDESGMYWCDTLEGGHIVTEGDWIITGIKGEKYPCKPDIFAATYEPVEE